MIIDLKKKDIFILVLITIVLISIIIYTYFQRNSSSGINLKKNSANTYSSAYITNDKQASIYLSTYYNLISNDDNEAYKLLDSSIKEKMDLNTFRNYISNHDFSSTKIQKFRIYTKNGKEYYDIYDINNNHIQFKTDGVMQYSVIIYN